jgi:pantoate--beta-alanine ligase
MSEVLKTVNAARAWADAVRRDGKRLAFVPTMGFLHDGHLSLMREGKARADVVAASIFVNPTQFGPKEDLSRYPRDLDGDLAKCGSTGVHAVFVPEDGGMYPDGFQTYVEVTEASKGLDGDRRPGHFRGVATVVAKLFCILRPHLAFFGEKDYQQVQVVKALARDLDLGVEVVAMPTIRDPDGLAMSSRNSYLTADERRHALSLSRGLRAARHLFANGVKESRELVSAVRQELEGASVREDYVSLVDAATLEPLTAVALGRPARLLVAGFVGTTRLIDNVGIGD